MGDRVVITPAFLREWDRIRAKVDGMSGAPVTNTMTAISIAPPPPTAPTNDPDGDDRVWAKVSSTATKSGTYNGKSASRNSTDFDETVSGALSLATYYDFSATEDIVLVNFFETGTDSHLLPVDCVVFGWRRGTTKGGKPIVELDHFFAGVFPVALTQTGGSNGTKTTTASWTYTVKTIDSAVTLGTGVALTRPRPNGTATAGTKGLAYYDASGTLTLWDAGEIYGIKAC